MADNNYSINIIPNLRVGLNAGAVLKSNSEYQSRVIDYAILSGKNAATNAVFNGNKEIKLKGPSDVIGIKESAISRVSPVVNRTDFEYNFFPFIEFRQADFLWRYSVYKEGTDKNKILPWLALLTLERGTFTVEKKPLSKGWTVDTLTVNDGIGLPNLENLWAWAHAQFLVNIENEDLEDLIHNRPETNCCRLICPAQLKKSSNYTAFLVPAYEAGRKVALGEDFVLNQSLDAWKADVGKPFTLPIFYQWDFSTSEFPEFEALVKKIRNPSQVKNQIQSLQGKTIDASENGLINNSDLVKNTNLSTAVFQFQGALVPDTAQGTVNDSDVIITNFKQAFKQQLASQVNIADDEDPLITIPVYGNTFSNNMKADIANEKSWIFELNSNPVYRIAASLGIQIVQKNQDEYISMYLEQIGRIKDLRKLIQMKDIAKTISASIDERHFSKLSSEKYLFITQQYHNTDIKTKIDASGLPKGIMSYPGRKVLTPKARSKYFKDDAETQAQMFSSYLKPKLTGEPAIPVTKISERKIAYQNSVLGCESVSVKPLDTNISKQQVQATPAIDARFNSMYKIKASSTLNKGNVLKAFQVTAAENPLDILSALEIPYPTSVLLRQISMDYIITNLNNLPDNAALLMKPNHKFIESFLLGMNYEINKKLMWQDIYMPPKLSLFRHFWDSSAAQEENISEDIIPISSWKGELGNNNNSSSNETNNILVIRGDLIRRCSEFDIVAVQVSTDEDYTSNIYVEPQKTGINNDWGNFLQNRVSTGKFNVIEPLFFDRLSPDTVFIGFSNLDDPSKKCFFVITEPLCLPRFGLDVQDTSMQNSDLNWGQITTDRNWVVPWEQSNSAKIANKMLQLPAQIILPSTYFMFK